MKPTLAILAIAVFFNISALCQTTPEGCDKTAARGEALVDSLRGIPEKDHAARTKLLRDRGAGDIISLMTACRRTSQNAVRVNRYADVSERLLAIFDATEHAFAGDILDQMKKATHYREDSR